ncbi:MAG: NAD(P)H-dependent oxidoreductase [Clostridiales bacterium]|nr:NAD(P)H-dependent oxidoreductase [Clostridiales bacterium]
MILFIDACVREASRTRRLALRLLDALGGDHEQVILEKCDFPAVDEAFLQKRDRLLWEGAFSDPMFGYARQFAKADTIVIAAPFWDLSFPAALKSYLEQINVVGITFRYTPDGVPQGMCRAKKLYYVTTAGGDFFPEEYGFGYVKALAQTFYGINDVELIKAVGLDIEGVPVEVILRECEEETDRRFRREQ